MSATTITILLAAVVLALLAVASSMILGWANRKFHVHVDPKILEIDAVLPGANCGGCGFVGCGEYAEAVAEGRADVTLCAPGGSGCAEAIAEIMGVEVDASFPYKAVVHCAAGLEDRLGRTDYVGEKTCAAANLVGGYQGCIYGCLGLGDCVEACDYDAIHIRDGLARVTYDNCTGCRACATTCPRNIISMVPFKAKEMLVVACSNEDFGNDVKAVCKTGCIGCKACTRNNELITMEGNLPVINYDAYDPDFEFEPVLDKCKMESLIFLGEPTPEDLAALADEEMPERVKADFHTTVDETEWRG